MWQASSASSRGWMKCRLYLWSTFKRHVVKLPDEPRPVPAGMSAMLVISMFGSRDSREQQRLANDRMFHVFGTRRALDLRIANQELFQRRAVHRHVDVLRDGRRNREAAVRAVVRGQIRSAAAERNSKRAPADDHAMPPGLVRRATTRNPRDSSGSNATRSMTRAAAEMPSIDGPTNGSVQNLGRSSVVASCESLPIA